MSLVLKFNARVRSACNELVIGEGTGAYSEDNPPTPDNPGGYGFPNTTIGQVVAASLLIISPSNQSYTIDLFATTYFPTTDTSSEYVIPLSQIGNRTSIEDGLWTFVYSVTDGSTLTTYQVTRAYIFTCNSQTCVASLLANLDISDCNCTDTTDKENNYLKSRAFLDALLNAANCGNITEYTKIKNILDKMCVLTTCVDCN